MDGGLLKFLRKEMNLSQAELAEKIGMSRKTICDMETNKAPIELRTQLAVRFLSEDSRKPKFDVEAVVQSYRGPAREFSEGDPKFDLMLTRAKDFLSYLSLWSGNGEIPEEKFQLNQQETLGFARAMAIAIEKNPDT